MPVPRPATVSDVEQLREIERSAGQLFSEIGMDAIALDDPPTAENYCMAIERGEITVIDLDEAPTAYLRAFEVDGLMHLEQLSVAASGARRGLGRMLIEHAADSAQEQGLAGLTLTTFASVPWNAPYYARLGFRVLDEREWSPGLRRIRDEEAADGLDAWPRVCMIRESR